MRSEKPPGGRLALASSLVVSFALATAPFQAAQAGPSTLVPFLFLSTQTGCAGVRKAGECPVIDFAPSGAPGVTPGNFHDDAIDVILEACNPAAIGRSWLDDTAPSLPSHCEELILDGLPLSQELEIPVTDPERRTRAALARALHALLFIPLADPGSFFGSNEAADYCPEIYNDYLGAEAIDPTTGLVVGSYAYRKGIARTGLHLVRFILERVRRFTFEEDYADDDNDGWSTIASERNGRIKLGTAFASEVNPIVLASTLVHESRHTEDGFQDASRHTTCPQEGDTGAFFESACDVTNFGAYGAGIAYIDAALHGGIRSIDDHGQGLFSLTQLRSAYFQGCQLYLNRIEEQSETLSTFLKELGCEPSPAETPEVLSRIYGIPPAEIQYYRGL